MHSPAKIFTLVVAALILSTAAFSGVYRYNAVNLTMPSNVTVASGDYVEYEGLDTVQSSDVGRFEYVSGSAGALVAGDKISLTLDELNATAYTGNVLPFYQSGRKMGFMAHDGSTVWGMIDSQGNGISDYLEETDSDGDGFFDALELAMGTSSTQGMIGFETDGDGDGIYDKVFDVATAGTASQFGPGSFSGYKGKISTAYNSYSSYFSLSTSFGAGFLDTFLGGYSEWLDLDFTVTYTYASFLGWEYEISFTPESSAKTYVVQGYYQETGWIDLSNDINQSGQWTGWTSPLVGSLAHLPPFIRVLEVGKALATGQAGVYNDIIELTGLGELLPNDQLKLNLPEVLGIPTSVANQIDWGDKKLSGNNTPWMIDLDADGVAEIQLDPINQSGKVSIPVLGKIVEIKVDKNGVQIGIGKFKVKRNNNGEFVVDLPTNAIGTDGSFSLSFSPSSSINVYRPQPYQSTVPTTLTRDQLVIPVDEINNRGVGIRVNMDDDNQNAQKDGLESIAIVGENDLIEISVGITPATFGSGGLFRLKTTSNIKVWADKDRSSLIAGPSGNVLIAAPPPNKYWVECIGPVQNGEVEFIIVPSSGGAEYSYEKIPFNSFTGLIVGLSGFTLPPSIESAQNNGMYTASNELYLNGYDVAYFDPDEVGSAGEGVPYDILVKQITDCSVSSIGIFGHSRGGGSTYVLSKRLDDHSHLIGTYSEDFNAYVDAIQKTTTFAETRMPPGSNYLVNYYQTAGILSGGPVSGAENHDWSAYGAHGDLDNDVLIILNLINKADARVSR